MSSNSIMLVGLPPHHPIVTAKFDAAVIAAMLQETEESMLKAGYNYKSCLIGPDELSVLVDELKGQAWDGVVVGFGVRGMPELTVFFEQIINAVRVHAPNAKLLFNSSPPSTLDAAGRLGNY